MPPVEVIANHELCVTRCMRKYIWSHQSRKCIWSHRFRKCIWSHRITVYTDDVNYSHRPITRRPAKFGRNRSSLAGDINDFSKSKMAAVRHFGSSSKVKTHREHIYSLNAATCKIWQKSVKSCRRY